MKRKLLIILFLTFTTLVQVFAQNRTVTGTVTAQEDGLPIPGVTVKVKGTTIGTQTNTAGKYALSVPQGATLVFSFIGYQTLSLPITGATRDAALALSSNQLGEVVVTTSLGIKHSERDLGYATATVSPKELTATNTTNIANGLTAKVAGLAVYSLDNGVDPNISIVLRGNRSLEGDNNALIVVDGIPIPGGTLSSINPNDIADITILKGAGSAALYGSEASNGAILVTTKRGTGDSKPTVVYQNSLQVEKVAFYPKLNTEFGTYGGETSYRYPGTSTVLPAQDPLTGATAYIPYENQEYGPAYNGAIVPIGAPAGSATGPIQMIKYSPYPTPPIKQFFQTGYTEQNDISYSQGDSKNSIFISAQDAYRTTVVPNDKNIRNAFSVRGHRTYGMFSMDFSASYAKSYITTYNSGTTNENGTNNLTGIPTSGITGSYVANAGAQDLYSAILQLPAFLNLSTIKNPNNSLYGNPNDFYDAYAINPYWIVDNSRRDINKDVLLSQIKLKLEPTKWLDISYQLSDNFGINQEKDTQAEVDFSAYGISDYFSAGNTPSGFKNTGKAPGQVADYYSYGDGSGNPYPGYSRLQGDAIIDLHYTFVKDLKTSLVVGNTVRQQYEKLMGSYSNDLLIPGFYNINTIAGNVSANEGEYMIRNIAYFGDLNIGWKDYLNFEATLRNEQDSRLSLAERNFNYPSAKLSFIPTDLISALKDNKILNYAKLYGSFSRVGNIDIQPYQIQNVYTLTPGFPYGSLGGLTAGTENFSPTLKPELTTEVEVGAELQFFNSRLSVNATYYDQHVKNQTVGIGTSIATGYSSSLLNIGETESKGQELQVTGQILTQAQNKVGWTLGVNFSNNNSKVISLLPGITTLQLAPGSMEYAVVGQAFPLLEGTDFQRSPSGQVVVNAENGYPSAAQGLTTYGRTTPQYDLGLTTSVSYKFVSISAVAEYRGGDVTYNGIGGTLDFTGSGYTSTQAGRQVFVYPNSVINTAPIGSPPVYVKNTNVNVLNGNYGFWQGSAYASVDYPYVSSGAFWKLREVNITFNLDKFVKQSKFIKGASVALTGRNLFIWVPKNNPWTDPEFSDSDPSSNLRGVNDIRETPGTRVFGGSLKLTF
jgi:TonB-linked SusC/RagA family outer membrane protein